MLGTRGGGTGRVVSQFVSTCWTASDVTDLVAGAVGSPVGLVGAGLNLTFTANHSKRDLYELCGEIESGPVR